MWQEALLTGAIWITWKILPAAVKGFVKRVLTDSIVSIRNHAMADINTLFVCNALKSFLITKISHRAFDALPLIWPTIREILKGFIYTVTFLIYMIPILLAIYLEQPNPAPVVPARSPEDDINPTKIQCSGLRADLERCTRKTNATVGAEKEWYCTHHERQGKFVARRREWKVER